VRRAAVVVWPLLQQTAAAGVAWAIAVQVLDRPSPFFAPIAAVVGLNATLGRRGSNALRLLLGVLVGIVVGELAVVVAGGGVWTLTAATFTAMLVARLLDGTRIVIAQAAVSAILITAFGDPAEGPNRLVEALIGGGVALVFSQLVFSPEPLRLLRRAESAVLSVLADGLQLTARALAEDEDELADEALSRVRGLRDQLTDLATMRKASGRIVRHSVTWRSRRIPVVHERESAEQLDLLAGSCVMLTRTAMATAPDRRATLTLAVERLARSMAELAAQPGSREIRQHAAEHALQLVRWVTEEGGSVPAQSPLAAAYATIGMVGLDVMIFAGVEPAQARQAMAATVHELQLRDPPEPTRRRWHTFRWPRRPGEGPEHPVV
jgi:uncharacterized membrane protein YgaE (UPF0421/DUF939 family)